MSIPRPLRDHLFVQIDKDKLDRTDSGVYIPDWQPGDKDAQQGIVVATPIALSPERRLANPGMDGQTYSYADLQDLPRVGEVVYLRPNTFKPDMEYPGHPGVFLIDIGQVIAISNKSGMPDFIKPFQGLLLCEEVYDDNVRVREDGRRYSVRPNPKQPADWPAFMGPEMIGELDPLPIPFALRVVYDGVPLKGQDNLVGVGDVVIGHRMAFTRHALKNADHQDVSSRWTWQPTKVTIEGREYCILARQCVMAVEESHFKIQLGGEMRRAYQSDIDKAIAHRKAQM
jgi:co-chaperonin GroES (HSP10)